MARRQERGENDLGCLGLSALFELQFRECRESTVPGRTPSDPPGGTAPKKRGLRWITLRFEAVVGSRKCGCSFATSSRCAWRCAWAAAC